MPRSKTEKYRIDNPFDPKCGAPISVHWNDRYKTFGKRRFLTELMSAIGDVYACETTQKTRFLGMDFTCPRIFAVLPYISTLSEWGSYKFGFKYDGSHMYGFPFRLVVNGKTLCGDSEIVRFGNLTGFVSDETCKDWLKRRNDARKQCFDGIAKEFCK